MMAANYRHIGGGENRLGRHYSRFSGIWLTAFLADQSLTLRKSQNAGSNRPSRANGVQPPAAIDCAARAVAAEHRAFCGAPTMKPSPGLLALTFHLAIVSSISF